MSKNAEFQGAWQKFFRWVGTRDSAAGKSSMWRDLVRDFAIRDPAADPASFFADAKFRAYNLVARSEENVGAGARRFLLVCSDALARALSLLRARIWAANVGGLGLGRLAYHPAGARWLRRLGLDAEYQAFCDHFSLTPANSSAIKSFYVSSVIASALKEVPNPRILEIGAGTGVLASIAQYRLKPGLYVIVDLPEMLLVSSMSLREMFPDVSAAFLYPDSTDELPSSGFCFCTPDAVDRLAPDAFDMAVNIDSFQEMNRAQVESYLKLAQRLLVPGGLLLNINRRKHLEEEGFDNNPLTYPYDPRNHVLRWETDLFMDRTFNYDRSRIDGWLLRLERAVKP